MSTTAELAASIQELTEGLRLAANDPADQIRLLCELAQFGGEALGSAVAASPIRQAEIDARKAVGSLCRRSALASLALAVRDYAPASSTEAQAALKRIKPLYDAEILLAGDLGQNDTYEELRSLRSAVVEELQQRAMQLPEVVEIARSQSQPALTVAYSLYDDATRCDELANRADAPHPLFMPLRFSALNS